MAAERAGVRSWPPRGVQFLKATLAREIKAFEVLSAELASLDGDDQFRKSGSAWATWARKLLLPEVVRFTTNAQREGCQRAELSNLVMSEVRVGFHRVSEPRVCVV